MLFLQRSSYHAYTEGSSGVYVGTLTETKRTTGWSLMEPGPRAFKSLERAGECEYQMDKDDTWHLKITLWSFWPAGVSFFSLENISAAKHDWQKHDQWQWSFLYLQLFRTFCCKVYHHSKKNTTSLLHYSVILHCFTNIMSSFHMHFLKSYLLLWNLLTSSLFSKKSL